MDLQAARVFYHFFHGRRDTYAVQSSKKEGKVHYYRLEKEVTCEDYLRHFNGEEIIGIYPLLEDKTCKVAAIDLDVADLSLAKEVAKELPQPNYIEKSRSGNHHIWMFFDPAVRADLLERRCKRALTHGKQGAAAHCALYPTPSENLGVLIALPFQGPLMREGLTVFVNGDGIPFEDQIANLRSFQEAKIQGSTLPDDEEARNLFAGRGKTTGDLTRSGYDFSFCLRLAELGYSEEEALELLLQRPQLHSRAAAERTVHNAYAKVGKGFAHPQQPIVEAPVLTPIQKEEIEITITPFWQDLEPISREECYKAFDEELYIENYQHLDIFFASIIANLKSDRPIWILFVGPPGGGKTVPMMAVRNAPCVHMSSAFRPTALISGFGFRGTKEDMSLIPRLQDKVLLVKDMSSLLSQNREVTNEVLGLLRDAYDGYCSRPFGTGVERSYKTKFGFIGACTPDIDANWGLNMRLGERFLRYRLPSSKESAYKKVHKALQGIGREKEMEEKLERAASGFLKYLQQREEPLPPLGMIKEIGDLGQLGAVFRTQVTRSLYHQEVLVVPIWEEATRFSMQLAQMARALAFIRGKATNGEEEYTDLKALVSSALDSRTEVVLKALALGDEKGQTVKDLDLTTGISDFSLRARLNDLEVLRVVIRDKSTLQHRWTFIPWIGDEIRRVELWKRKV